MDSPPVPRTPSIRRRLASMLYETLLLGAVVFFGFLLPQIVLGVVASILLPSGILFIHAILVVAAYCLLFWRSGRTLAMQTWKIRLRAADGTSAPSLDRLLLRFMLAWPSILLFGIGLVWALVDRDRQFLHDRLAGTRLVQNG